MAEVLTIPDDFKLGMVVDLVVEGRPPCRVTITAVDGNTVTAAQFPDEDPMRSRFARGGVIKREDIDGLSPDGTPRQLVDFGCSYPLPPISDRNWKILEAINDGTYEPMAGH